MRKTKKEIELEQLATKRNSDYVCIPCGIQYLSEKQREANRVVTFHENHCGICGEHTGVTHIRHYNYGKIKR